jgi:hypothetical protein
MVISPNRRFVFIHLHKCAGTSIETALSQVLGVNDLVIGSTADGERHKAFYGELLKLKKHTGAREAIQVLGAARWAGFFTFAFVREPVEQLRSLYAYARGLAQRNPLTPPEQALWRDERELPDRAPYKFKAVQAAVQSPTLDAFLRAPLTWQDAGARAQWQSLFDADGRPLVNFIGRVEHIADDWATVCRRLDIDVPLGVHNPSPPLDPQSLSPAAWAQVRRHALRDYELLGYPLPAPLAAAG